MQFSGDCMVCICGPGFEFSNVDNRSADRRYWLHPYAQLRCREPILVDLLRDSYNLGSRVWQS